MALLESSPAGTRDTQSIAQGVPGRVVYHDGKVYLVALSDFDDYVHIYKWEPDAGVTDYSSVGYATETDTNTGQGMLACVALGDILHIGFISVADSVKILVHAQFDMSTDEWVEDQSSVSLDGSATLAADALNMCVGPSKCIHYVLSLRNAGETAYDLFHVKRTDGGAWTTETITTGLSAGAYLPVIDVGSGGQVLVLADNGTGGLVSTSQWTGWERAADGTWSDTDIEGIGQATLVHTTGNVWHAMFFGDKRHTIIPGKLAARTTTLGAIQFEHPDVTGGVVAGSAYGYGFSAATDRNEIHLVAAADGKLYQGGYVDNVWRPMRAISTLQASQTENAAAVISASEDGEMAVAVKLARGWYLFTIDERIPPRGGITHDFTLDGQGFMVAGPLQKADISQAVPRVSIATELKTEDNISDLSSVTQYSFHHGRGEIVFENPMAYANVKKLLTHIPNQVTPQLAPIITNRNGGSPAESFLVGPEGSTVGPGSAGVGPAIDPGDAQNFQGYPVDDIVYAGNYWLLVRGNSAANNGLYFWHNTNNEWTLEEAGLDTLNAIPQDLEIFNEDLWVAQGDTDFCRVYDFSASAWKDAAVPAYCLKTWDDKLWRADNINKVYYSEDADSPGSETWIEMGRVDDGSGTAGRVRRMEVYNGTLLIFTDVGVWQVSLNSAGAYMLLPLLNDAAQRKSTNGAAAANFGGVLYYNVGNGGVTRFDGSSRSEMGPNRNPVSGEKISMLPAGMRGDFTHMVPTDALMYMSIDAGASGLSSVWVYNGIGWNEFWEADEVGQRCRWVGHTPKFTSTGVMATRNLWVESGGKIYRIQLPTHGEDPLKDPTLTYRAGGQYMLMTGWQHENLISVDKVLHELIARFENFSSEEFEPNLHVYFQTEEGEDSFDLSKWTYLTTFSRNPVEIANILNRSKWSANPNEYGGAIGGLVYKQIRFLVVFDMDLGGATTTQRPPVLSAFGKRFVLRTERRFGFTAIVQAYDEIENLLGEKETDQAATVRNQLYGFADQRSPHYLDDGTLAPLINWVLNPGFELDSNNDGLADRWSKVNGPVVTTSRSAKHKAHGRYSQKVTVGPSFLTSGIQQTGLWVPPGVLGHVEIAVFVESGIGAQLLLVNAATGEVLGRSEVAFPAQSVRPPVLFQDLHAHIDPQDRLVEIGLQVVVPSEMADNSTTTVMYADSAFLYLGQEVPHYYVDGDQPRCQWVDTTVEPYLSPSYRRGSYAVYINGMTEVMRKDLPTTGGRVIKQSDITLQMREAGV